MGQMLGFGIPKAVASIDQRQRLAAISNTCTVHIGRNKTLDEETLSDIFGELRQVGPKLRAWHQQVTAAEIPAEPVAVVEAPAEAEADDEDPE